MTHTHVYISGAEVKQVNRFRFLGVTITEIMVNTCHHTGLKNTEKALLLTET